MAGTIVVDRIESDASYTSTINVANRITFSNTVTHSSGTANGVAYLNGSKVLTTGSALTFDGTTLTVASRGIAKGGMPAGSVLQVVTVHGTHLF